jgi:glycosyltransferase involved in cell wall biosynthesis
MKISIITVAFNSQEYITDCLLSVANQSYPDIEHVVIDGGSTDRTIELVKRYGTSNTILVSEKDYGIYDAMNKGLSLSNGDIVAFLNSDDWYSGKDVILNVVNKFCTLGNSYSGLFCRVLIYNQFTDRIFRIYSGIFFRPFLFNIGYMPPHPGIFIRKSRIGNNSFDNSYLIAGDFKFLKLLTLGENNKLKRFPIDAVFMRSGGRSSTKGSWEKNNREIAKILNAEKIKFAEILIGLRAIFKIMDLMAAVIKFNKVNYWFRRH